MSGLRRRQGRADEQTLESVQAHDRNLTSEGCFAPLPRPRRKDGRRSSLKLEGFLDADAGGFQQRSGTSPAIRHRLEANGTTGATRGPAIDAREMVEVVVDFSSTPATRFHWTLLRRICR